MLIIGLNYGYHIGVIYGLLLFTLGAGTISHRIVYFYSVKILTRFCSDACYLSPTSSTGVNCEGFDKNLPISATAFVMASVVGMEGLLVDCEKN